MKAEQWTWPLKADGTRIIDANGCNTGIYTSYYTEQDEYGFDMSSTYEECCKRIEWITDVMNRAFEAECEAVNIGG